MVRCPLDKINAWKKQAFLQDICHVTLWRVIKKRFALRELIKMASDSESSVLETDLSLDLSALDLSFEEEGGGESHCSSEDGAPAAYGNEPYRFEPTCDSDSEDGQDNQQPAQDDDPADRLENNDW